MIWSNRSRGPILTREVKATRHETYADPLSVPAMTAILRSLPPHRRMPSAKTTLTSESLIAAALVALGIIVTTGWIAHVPSMTQLFTNSVPMVFNTAACFLLLGIALLTSRSHAGQLMVVRTCIGVFLIWLCSITIVEFTFDASLGIDLPSLHTWFDYGNTRPGMMAPNTALGFITAGVILLLNDRVISRRRAILLVLATFALLTIGLTGLVGYLLAPDLLYGWARSARMAIHTASGMLLAAMGFWIAWSKSDWYAAQGYFREDQKIRFLGATILAIVTMTVGMIGFVLLQRTLETSLENGINATATSRIAWFRQSVDEVSRHATSTISLSGIEDAALPLLQHSWRAADRTRFNTLAAQLVTKGYYRVTLLNSEDAPMVVVGEEHRPAMLSAPLVPDGSSQLVWDTVMLVRIRSTVLDDDAIQGYIVVDYPVPALERVLFNVDGLGETGETGACLMVAQAITCFPGSRHVLPYTVKRSNPHTMLPVEHAFAGKTGSIYTLDYRGHNVLAAFGLLAPGFGFVIKQDTEEVYAVIRHAFAVGVPIFLLVALLGAAFLYSQLAPLATRMRASERSASEKERQIRTIVGAVGDGILSIDQHGKILTANAAIFDIFGHVPDDLIGTQVSALIPPDVQPASDHGIDSAPVVNVIDLVGSPHAEVNGLRKDGSLFPLELTMNDVDIGGERVFVGVMRDISGRKEATHRLERLAHHDLLTGLPNRALFTDRLTMALERAKRSKSAMALMFLDLDGFKRINDSLGHHAGDELLVQFAQRITAAVRKTDTVARLAGDEFTIILEDLAQPHIDALAVADKIIASMQTPFMLADQQVTVTSSIGMAIHGADVWDVAPARLIQMADQAMYAAKRAGKNCICVA